MEFYSAGIEMFMSGWNILYHPIPSPMCHPVFLFQILIFTRLDHSQTSHLVQHIIGGSYYSMPLLQPHFLVQKCRNCRSPGTFTQIGLSPRTMRIKPI
jgi:hypothetical protein